MASGLIACNQTMRKPRPRGSCAILPERTYLIASARTDYTGHGLLRRYLGELKRISEKQVFFACSFQPL